MIFSRKFAKLLGTVVTVVAVCAAAEGDWPQFRGPSGSGVGTGQHPPIQWDATKGTNILWSAEIPGLANSSPVVWGDRIFVTTAISSDPKQTFRTGLYGDTDSVGDRSAHQWKVMALDKKNGKVLWDQLAYQGIPKTKRHPKSSQASPTPVTDGKVVIAYFGSEGLVAYSVEGKLLWKKDLGLQNAGWFFDPDSEWGAASSPVIYKNMVIVQCDRQKDSFVAAFDLKDGKEIWRTSRAEIPAWGTPTLVPGNGKTELVTNGTKAIRGYDADTGKELWTLGPNSEITCTTPVFANGLIFVTAGYPPVQPIYAIKIGSTGDLTLKPGQESSDAIAWSKKSGGSYLPSPIVYDGLLYLINNNGVMTVYDAKSGNRAYQQRVGTGVSFVASPIVGAGKIYAASEDGDIFVIKAGDKFEQLAKNPMGEPILASPALAGDLLIVRSARHLFAIAEAPAK
ncbi:MAG TPA: PQQ-binding-like beta-propeller repeat protein [Bryobacteraceae bacterium]|nr:PQQ-binding-like beta-propeller repeat protein [Bryobacteraceae bacterium]